MKHEQLHPKQVHMYHLLTKIPRGRLTTYGDLAAALGDRHLARAVGHWLHVNDHPHRFPCYKVVASDGSLGGYAGGLAKKIQLMREDGIVIRSGKVANFDAVRFRFPKPKT